VRLSALATTAAVFAHEIANPLNGIGMSVQLVPASLDGQEVNPLSELPKESMYLKSSAPPSPTVRV
jgi:nitrogen-specific signal transduction histidine kinase